MNDMNLAVALEMATQTHPGKIRTHNEDALYADAGLGLVVLADGMGGYRAGEVASGMAVSLIASSFASLVPTFQAGNEQLDDSLAAIHLIDQVGAANLATIMRRGTSRAMPVWGRHWLPPGSTMIV